MFSWMQSFIAPFVSAVGGMFWHDSITLVLGPTSIPIDISYLPDPKFKSLIIGLTFGDVYEYDPDTGTIGPEILSPDIGVYHACKGWMDWHWDPFVKSILRTNPYPQLGWCSRENPYILRIVNNTDKYIWSDITFWVIKFPIRVRFLGREWDPEDLFNRYMRYVMTLYYRFGEVLERVPREVLEKWMRGAVE